MKKNYANYLACLTGMAIFMLNLTACKQDALFKDGKRQYTSKADSVISLSGINRLKIKFVVPGPDVVSAKIFWNNRKNVMEIPVNQSAGDSVSVIISPLDEGDYAFEVITYDAQGHTSIPIKITGKVYGDQFVQTLSNRQVNDIIYDGSAAYIFWGDGGQEIRTEVTYTDNADVQHTIKVAAGKDSTKLVNIKPAPLYTTIQHRSVFFPAAAIDTLYALNKSETVITGNLKDLAKEKGVTFGSLITYGGGVSDGVIYDGSPNGAYTNFCLNEFNVGQATWGPSRWSREGPSNFNDVNAVINWSRAHYDEVMAMLIVGPDNYMPSWFTTGTFTPEEMDVMLKNLIAELMASNDNKSKVDEWCVANELFNNDGTYRTMKWNDMGWEDDASGLTGTDQINLKHPVFVGKAFKYCREITNALLELREYGIEHGDPASSYYNKHKAYYQLLKHLQAKGNAPDIVGIQAHVWIGDVPSNDYSEVKTTVAKFKQAGFGVYLTELDVAANKVNSQIQPWTAALAEQQKKDYHNYVKAAIEGGVDLISLWGARDNNDAGWLVNQNPLLLDAAYHRKPAYYGIQKAFFEANK